MHVVVLVRFRFRVKVHLSVPKVLVKQKYVLCVCVGLLVLCDQVLPCGGLAAETCQGVPPSCPPGIDQRYMYLQDPAHSNHLLDFSCWAKMPLKILGARCWQVKCLWNPLIRLQ